MLIKDRWAQTSYPDRLAVRSLALDALGGSGRALTVALTDYGPALLAMALAELADEGHADAREAAVRMLEALGQ